MKHLLAISIGPVQEFISAARKTSDLYAGSAMLAEISKAVAAAVQKDGLLIFPADIKNDGPNKILIELNDGVMPNEAASRAKDAASTYLNERWKHFAGKHMGFIDTDLAQDQIDNFLEFFAAWEPLPGDDAYKHARADLDLLLAGRKALRDFSNPLSRPDLAKSPLDPARDGVLLTESSDEARLRLGLKPTESLDAISQMKRLAGSAVQAPSTSLLASLAVPKELNSEIIADLSRFAEQSGMGSDYSDLLYPERASTPEFSPEKIAACAGLLKRALSAAGLNELGGFPAYYAILQADGDRMGRLLGKLNTADEHRAFSRSLSRFADDARAIVRLCGGHLVYAGGDDVLALLPLNAAITCADRLRKSFHAALREHRKQEDDGTLSAGIAIVHHLDALQTSLEHARAAEQFAKKTGGRNSLALALHTRGGAPVTVCFKWSADPDPESHVMACAAVFRDTENGVSRGFPYELAAMAREWLGSGLPVNRMQAEALRLMDKKAKSDSLGHVRKAISACGDADALLSLASTLVIARFLSNYPASHPSSIPALEAHQ